MAVFPRYSWGSRISPGSFITNWSNLSFLSLVSLLTLHAAHVHFIHGPRLARETDISFIALEARVSPGARGAREAEVPFLAWRSWHTSWSWRAGLSRGPHDTHLSFGAWEPGKAGGALLPRKAGEPRLPCQAGETLGAFIAFGTRHVQTWESGEALLSFHSRGA